ncbi:unnamed protein product [Rangifer tarandus platyrhynchus]|uniref:Uncharacterized protein n=2 Tax=Rangifer tarandus platyrhynchus TaxID=3082113 RepID=A0ABN8YK31_RANTA|nr:unnamed protein product [Rangifer tarandus platyrhynchus]CAI9698781.1 unnamed protein product [Rangifer tarandus platyrhynchus]
MRLRGPPLPSPLLSQALPRTQCRAPCHSWDPRPYVTNTGPLRSPHRPTWSRSAFTAAQGEPAENAERQNHGQRPWPRSEDWAGPSSADGRPPSLRPAVRSPPLRTPGRRGGADQAKPGPLLGGVSPCHAAAGPSQ